MSKTPPGDGTIEALLTGARSAETPPGLLERVLADAEAARPRSPAAGRRRPLRSVLAEALREIGGWPVATGLVAASVAGLGLGLAAPDILLPAAGSEAAAAFEIVDLVPGYGIGDAWGN